jgi:hypothetical protein
MKHSFMGYAEHFTVQDLYGSVITLRSPKLCDGETREVILFLRRVILKNGKPFIGGSGSLQSVITKPTVSWLK